ncbi:MAG TPA: hypothetical protein VNG53_05305, partial [Bacteroidia bacterium]|nr:hypothetical protein [Bacteroidia bacterium]
MNSLLTFERQYCPVCKSENHLVLFEATHSSPEFFNFIKLEKFYGKAFYDSYNNGDLKGMTFKIVECNDCHFIFQKEVLNE